MIGPNLVSTVFGNSNIYMCKVIVAGIEAELTKDDFTFVIYSIIIFLYTSMVIQVPNILSTIYSNYPPVCVQLQTPDIFLPICNAIIIFHASRA